ncbi:GlsB/YeaQ/YmgE family stress response membrane protein [Dysgonomonas sp. OttesenSCG-928-M03]|nr:GlsB/YeaQ/YmgE family stress response membrane protein [Dysgonomonas sp. OttesenSCG-928-M03]
MGFIISIAIGIAAGFIASKVIKMNLGILFCLIVGIAGAVLGNIVFGLLEIRMNGYLGGFIMSTVGAIMVLWLVYYFKKKG